MSCPSWQWRRTGYRWSPVWTLPVAPLWCDLGRCSRTVVVIKLRQTSAFLEKPKNFRTDDKLHNTWPVGDCFQHFRAMFEFLGRIWSRWCNDVTSVSCPLVCFLSIKTLFQNAWDTHHPLSIPVLRENGGLELQRFGVFWTGSGKGWVGLGDVRVHT